MQRIVLTQVVRNLLFMLHRPKIQKSVEQRKKMNLSIFDNSNVGMLNWTDLRKQRYTQESMRLFDYIDRYQIFKHFIRKLN